MEELKTNVYGEVDEDNIPLPQQKNDVKEEITVEDIKKEIIGLDETGYSRSVAILFLQKVTNFDPNTEEYVKEEDKESVENIELRFTKFELQDIDDEIVSLIMKFDTALDKIMKDVLNILKEYEDMFTVAANSTEKTLVVPLITVSFMPLKYKARAMANFKQPIAYFKTVGENNEATQLQILFKKENVEFLDLELDENELKEMEIYIRKTINNTENII